MTKIVDIGQGKRISDVTQRLMDVAAKGEEKTITAHDLIQKFVDGEAAPDQIVQILVQNQAWAPMLLGAIAFSMGIKPTQQPVDQATAEKIDEAAAAGNIVQILEGFTPWYGESCDAPVVKGDEFFIQLRDGTVADGAGDPAKWVWQHNPLLAPYGGDIVAYKRVEKLPDWVDWEGGEYRNDILPLFAQDGVYVEYRLRNGDVGKAPAVNLPWWHDNTGDDIVAYRIVGETV
jgi:hypothetical protein